MPASPSQPSLGSRTLRGMFWAYGSYVGGRALTLVSTAILARLLTPGDFGLVALALAFMAFADVVRGLGPSEWLVVVDEEEVLDWAETVWVVNVGIGVVVAAVAAGLGPVAAGFFDEPKLTAILPVLGLNFLLSEFASAHYALAQKRLNFKLRTAAELTADVTRGLTGIALALAGFGVWSLVLAYVAGTLAMTVTLLVRVPWRPHLRPQRRHLPQLLRFGGPLSGVSFLAAILNQFDKGVIGRALGSASLGLYTLATRLPELLILNLAVVAGKVLLPAFATLGKAERGQAFLTSIRYTMMVCLPMSAALIVLAEPVILVAFGDQWRGAIVPMQILSLWALMAPASMVCGTLFKATARADILLKLAVPQAALLIVGSILLVDQGLRAIAWLQAAIAIVFVLVALEITRRMLGVGARKLMSAIVVPVVAALGLAAILEVVSVLIGNPYVTLLVAGLVGTVAYVGLLAVLDPSAVSHIRRLARPASKAGAEPTVDPATSELPLSSVDVPASGVEPPGEHGRDRS